MEILRIKSHCSVVSCSGESRPSARGGEGGHPDPDIRGGVADLKKKLFGHSGLNLV